MGFLDTIQNSLKGHFDKKKEQKELVDRLRLETKVQEQIIFEKEFKKNALEVAKAQAKKQAAELSGIRKLRAMNRARNLSQPHASGSFFSKLGEHTQRNLAKRDENIKKTAVLREAAKKMREEKLQKTQILREQRMAKSKSFGQSYV